MFLVILGYYEVLNTLKRLLAQLNILHLYSLQKQPNQKHCH